MNASSKEASSDYVSHCLFDKYLDTFEETSLIILRSLHLINMPEIDVK